MHPAWFVTVSAEIFTLTFSLRLIKTMTWWHEQVVSFEIENKIAFILTIILPINLAKKNLIRYFTGKRPSLRNEANV